MKRFPISSLLAASALLTTQAFALNAPTGGALTPAGPAAMALSWTDASTDETGFEVERYNGVGWDIIDTVPANQTYFYDRGLSESTSYTYRVRAINASDMSAPLDLGSATTTIKMNVIFFLADDMGYKDIVGLRNEAIDGATIYETPALDSLIDQALVVNNAYCSGPRCVVARRSIQTGKYDWRPEAVPNNKYYLDHDGSPKGGGLWAGGTTVAGATIGTGVAIPDNETYGEAVNAAGYRTAFLGKYHLGESPSDTPVIGYSFGDQPARGPDAQGYDVSIGSGHAGAPPASYFAVENQHNPGNYTFELPDLDDANYGTAAPVAGEYITDRLTNKAIGFMQDVITNYPSEPFHMTLAHYAVHTPMEAKVAEINYFKARKTAMATELANHPMAASPLITDTTTKTRMIQDNVVYAAMMKSYDDSLAALRDYLAATDDPRNPGKKLSETTIIVVSSDHGGKSTTPVADNKSLEDDSSDDVNPSPTYDAGKGAYKSGTPNAYSSYPTSNYPYRQGKTWVYEGGLKVPLIIYYPGLTPAGATTDAFVHHADLFASFVDMAGGSQSSESTDSISFMLTAGQPDVAARDELHHFFTNANKGTGNPAIAAYRKGDYKLLYFMVQRRVELYNLAADPYERDDVASARPDLAEEMLSEIYQQALSTGMSMPKPGSNTWSSEQNDVLLRNGLIGSVPAAPDAAPSWVGAGVTQISDRTLELNWTVNASNATHSVVYRRSDAAGETNFREHAYLPVGTTSFRDTNLSPDTTYRYRVESENLGGWASANTGNKTITLSSSSSFLAIDAADDAITTVPGELRCFNPLLNDEGEGPLTITSITQPSEGAAIIDGQWIRYLAPESFSGSSVTMTYTIEDVAGQTDTATVTFSLPISPSTESELEAWEFNDSAGTDLNDLNNTGSLNSLWRFNTTAATDGSGDFVVPGDAGTTTRRLPERGTANALPGDDFYASPRTTGKYRFEAKFTSWTVDAASAGDSLTLQINDSSNSSLARIDLRMSATDSELRLSGIDGNFRVYSYPMVQGTPVTAALEFDFDNDTIDYLIDGSVVNSFTFTGLNIGRISYIQSGAWGTAATSVQLDHLKLIELVPGGTLYSAYSSAYPWLGVLDRDPGDDPDFDGLTNFMEFALGTDPVVANGAAPVSVVDSGGPALRFTPNRDTSAISYTVKFSDDLSDWESITPLVVNSAAGTPVEAPLPSGGKGFGRVEVSEL